MQITSTILFSITAATISLGAIALTRRHWDVKGMPAIAGFNLGVAIWTGGNAAQLAAISLEAKLFWINIQYIGIAALPVGAFVFAATIAGYDEWLTRTRLGLLGAPLVAMVGLSWTNSFHHLVRETVSLGVLNGTVVIERTFGPVFWGSWIYSNLLLIIATILILRAVIAVDAFVRRRTAALLIGAVVPWAAHLLFIVGVSPVEPEPFFAVTSVAFVYAMIRYQQIDYAPPRRDRVIEEIDEGILGFSEANQVVDVNSAARRLLDLNDEPIIGESIESVFAEQPELLNWYRTDQKNDFVSVQNGDGTQHLSIDLTRIENELGGDTDILVLKDISEIKQQEQVLERQNERLEEFASVVSHDLRNPLNVAQGRIKLAKEECDTDHIDPAERGIERSLDLIEDMLELARAGQEVSDTEPVEVADLAHSCWETVETDDATVVVELESTIQADRNRLRQLLENLSRNAVEHGGGDVTVRIGSLPEGFYVEDDGPGIADDERESVWESGYSNEEDGTGLGLSIVKQIIESHDWDVRITNGSEGGARFEITGVQFAAE